MVVCYHSRMFRAIFTALCFGLLSIGVPAQSAVRKIVDTEHAFAKRALEIGIPKSFLEYMTDDAWAFTPDAVKAKPNSTEQAKKPRDETVLEWAPNFADAASDGTFGYTTGNWQIRPKAGADPTAFGEFNTIWVRQKDGSYKWSVDIGSGHGKQEYSRNYTIAMVAGGRHPSPPQFDMELFKRTAAKDAAKAYEKFASGEIRMIRRGQLPILGPVAAKAAVSGTMTFGTPIEARRASDMAYAVRPYTLGEEKGNELQVWKYDHKLAGWVIVLDVLKAIPPPPAK